jgi:hypothetical protein
MVEINRSINTSITLASHTGVMILEQAAISMFGQSSTDQHSYLHALDGRQGLIIIGALWDSPLPRYRWTHKFG